MLLSKRERISRLTSSEILWGVSCGARDRSDSPGRPSSLKRFNHLCPVFSLMPYALQSAATGYRPVIACLTNSSRIVTRSGVLQGTETSNGYVPKKVNRKTLRLTYPPGLSLTYVPGLYPRSPKPITEDPCTDNCPGLDQGVTRVVRYPIVKSPCRQPSQTDPLHTALSGCNWFPRGTNFQGYGNTQYCHHRARRSWQDNSRRQDAPASRSFS